MHTGIHHMIKDRLICSLAKCFLIYCFRISMQCIRQEYIATKQCILQQNEPINAVIIELNVKNSQKKVKKAFTFSPDLSFLSLFFVLQKVLRHIEFFL